MKWRTLSDMVSTYSTGASTSEFMSEFFPGQVLPRGHTLLVSVCNAVTDSSPPVNFVSSQVSFSLKIPFLAPSHSLFVCVWLWLWSPTFFFSAKMFLLVYFLVPDHGRGTTLLYWSLPLWRFTHKCVCRELRRETHNLSLEVQLLERISSSLWYQRS